MRREAAGLEGLEHRPDVQERVDAFRCNGNRIAVGIADAGLSRGLAGVSGSTLVVNVAGSRAAVRDGMATLGPLAAHIISQLSSLDI